MKNIFAFIFAFALASTAFAQQNFFEDTQGFLKKYVNASGMVNYQKIDKAELSDLCTQIASFNPQKATDAQRKAFYINAYNILVIQAIVQGNIPASPLDIAGFFDKKIQPIAGEKLTLNQIENKKLREVYKDPRIHFVLVCAAQSCPKLWNDAYTPQGLEMQLNSRTKLALNDPNFIQVKAGKVQVSKLFEWYNADFTTPQRTVVQYINQYRKTPITAAAHTYYEYNWQLNKQ